MRIWYGNKGADTIYGRGSDETINGLGGNDFINGLNGDDVLIGDKGNDWLEGGNGNDHLLGGEGDDYLAGGNGNDRLLGANGYDVIKLSLGYDRIDGGKGHDIVAAYDVTEGMVFDLSSNVIEYVIDGKTVSADLKNIEGISASDFDDIITCSDRGSQVIGADGDDLIEGGKGADNLYSGNGNDTVRGGEGDDTLGTGPGNDILEGGDGQDTIDLYAFQSGIAYAVTDVSLTLTDENGTWTTTLSGFENALGSWGDDSLTGDDGVNLLIGFAGNDTIFGLGGDDILCGAHGNDELTGGEGSDLFVFAYMDYATGEDDIITDFSVADDGIVLDAKKFSGLAGNGAIQEREGFEFKALKSTQFQSSADDFAHGKGVRLFYESDTGTLFYDHDGSKTKIDAIVVAHLDPGLALTAADLFVGTGGFV